MSITIEEYLKYLDTQKEINPTITGVGTVSSAEYNAMPKQHKAQAGNLNFRQIAAGRAGMDVKQEVASENPLTDFLGSALWGTVSGLTWGVSEFFTDDPVDPITKEKVSPEKKWDDMTDWEKAGWVTGEGLALFTPFVGPFA